MFGIVEGTKKQIVGLAVTPNLGLEACIFDKDTGEVVKYGQNFLEYNIASKEIQDMNVFRSAISDAFNNLDIPKESSNIYLVLPNVFCGFRSIEDSSIEDEAIESMILSDAGESYVFKQEEPVSAWVDVNARTGSTSKYIAYASLQRSVVEEIQDAAMDIGASIVGIESSASAIPRGIAASGICNDVIAKNQNWNILTINPNGYAITQMSGSRMLDYIEIPFAIMSFEGEEVYSALASAIGQYLPNYPAKKLVITSFTDNVSAKILKKAIVFEEEIVPVDSNKFGSAPVTKVGPDVIKQMANSLSLSALGASVPKFGPFATLNALGTVSYDGDTIYGEYEKDGEIVEITSSLVRKFSLTLSAIFLVIGFLLAGMLFGATSYFTSQGSALQGEINSLNGEIESLTNKVKASIVTLIRMISENNKTAVKYYDSLSSDIPPHLWLSYYVNKDGRNVAIEGFSLDIQDVYDYYKSLKILAPSSNIKLKKLDVFKDENSAATDLDDIVLDDKSKQQTFAFEISNTDYQKSFDESGNSTQNASNNKDKKGNSKSYAARIPNIPDVEINLKEIK